MIIGANQPRILPFIPYWRYASSCDVFDLGLEDPFTVKYHHRVLVGTDNQNEWLRLPLIGKAAKLDGKAFSEIDIDMACIEQTQFHLRNFHLKLPFWKQNEDFLLSLFAYQSSNLAGFLYATMVETSAYLNLPIKFKPGIAPDPCAINVTSRIASQLKGYGPGTYLAGPASDGYLDYTEYEHQTSQTVKVFTKGSPEWLAPYSRVSVASVLCHIGRDATRGLILRGLGV